MQIIDALEGALWGACFWSDVQIFSRTSEELAQLENREGVCPYLDQKISSLRNKMFVAGVGAIGTSAYTFLWSQRVNWLALGPLTVVMGLIAYGARLILSGMNAVDAWTNYNQLADKIKNSRSDDEIMVAKHRQNIALLLLIGNIIVVAWAVFSSISLLLASGVALLPLVQWSSSAALILLVGELVYKYNIDKIEKELEMA